MQNPKYLQMFVCGESQSVGQFKISRLVIKRK